MDGMSTNVEHEWESMEDYIDWFATDFDADRPWLAPQPGTDFKTWLQDEITTILEEGISDSWMALALAARMADLEHLQDTHQM